MRIQHSLFPQTPHSTKHEVKENFNLNSSQKTQSTQNISPMFLWNNDTMTPNEKGILKGYEALDVLTDYQRALLQGKGEKEEMRSIASQIADIAEEMPDALKNILKEISDRIHIELAKP
jgi:hypothetical protein